MAKGSIKSVHVKKFEPAKAWHFAWKISCVDEGAPPVIGNVEICECDKYKNISDGFFLRIFYTAASVFTSFQVWSYKIVRCDMIMISGNLNCNQWII